MAYIDDLLGTQNPTIQCLKFQKLLPIEHPGNMITCLIFRLSHHATRAAHTFSISRPGPWCHVRQPCDRGITTTSDFPTLKAQGLFLSWKQFSPRNSDASTRSKINLFLHLCHLCIHPFDLAGKGGTWKKATAVGDDVVAPF